MRRELARMEGENRSIEHKHKSESNYPAPLQILPFKYEQDMLLPSTLFYVDRTFQTLKELLIGNYSPPHHDNDPLPPPPPPPPPP